MSSPAELDVFRCNLDGINLIEASAGTGKTWNICGLYLRLLLERELETQRILVVTFTNAATAELRERIRARIVETLDFLAENTVQSGDPFVPNLIDELVNRRGMDALDIARRLDLALQTFDEAAIFTIHGFCQRALADNPFAAGLPMSMELLRDDADLRLQAVHDFWRRHLAGSDLAPALAAYLAQRGESPDKYAVLLKRHLAKPLAKLLWPDTLDAEFGAEFDLNPAQLDAAYADARATWLSTRAEIVDGLLAGLPALNSNTYNPDSVARAAQDWDDLCRANAALAPMGEKCGLFSAQRLADRTKKKQVTPEHFFFNQAADYLALRAALETHLEAARLRLLRLMLREAGTGLRELKRARRVVSFDDMLFNLHQRLRSEDSAWLAASLKQRFPAALIDEFQDTDPLQFDIFSTIYGAGDTPLFLVGDPKQAIYSFRHADLHTYLRAKDRASIEYSLAANQRASLGLLAALNRLFSANANAFMLPGLDYRRVEFGDKPRKDLLDRTQACADLQVWLLPDVEADVETDAETEILTKPAAKRAVAQTTAAEIARLIEAANNAEIEIGERPLRPGDIAVLVRSHAQGAEMKRALARLRVGSVELSQASVFQTADAEEVERVLRAILEPGRERLLRAALATELMGGDAAVIEAISHDEAGLMARILQFTDLRETWLRRGFGIMYRQLLAAENVAQRLLARADGERRLTNFLHLGECLHQAAETHTSPETLLRYLENQRRDDAVEDAAQLRLESDQNLVQIVTIHKSKGLEYPVVFCPYLWDGRAGFAGSTGEGREYHDDVGQPVVDFRGDAIEKAELEQIKATIKLEQAAETLRLIYVALTRAMNRCYLVAGCYATMSFGKLSTTESSRSMLNWLVAGGGAGAMSAADWFKVKLTPIDISAAWGALADASKIAISALPTATGTPISSPAADPESLSAEPPPARIPAGWRMSSYSGLSYGAQSEHAASDHDARIGLGLVVASSEVESISMEVTTDDILRFPRGAAAGDCIHAVFERIDFTAPASWPDAIAAALAAHPQSLPGVPESLQHERLSAMLMRLLQDVIATELSPGLRLNTVTLNRRLTELEFNLPAPRLFANEVNEALKTGGYPGPRLNFRTLEGYLKGFIDLVFEHDGRYFVLDWKSNYLGHAVAGYAAKPVADAMAAHGYHLQHLLYSVALDRYLRRRMADYQYASHFGGVLYLFVRGVRPTWKNADGASAGVFRHRPEAAMIQRFNALLDADSLDAANPDATWGLP